MSAAAVLLAAAEARSDLVQAGLTSAPEICCAIMGLVYSTSASGKPVL